MRFGLIGKSLTHSYSERIHNFLTNNSYELISLDDSDFDDFMKNRRFEGVNVTIPYKEKVIKYLDVVDETAREIGAVNTVVNDNGKLYGYNTDIYGFEQLLNKNNVDVRGKNALVLGSGGTSKTVTYVLKKGGIKSVFIVSRTPNYNEISYKKAQEIDDIQIIINTTPYGMMPNYKNASLINLRRFTLLETVIDVIYNPIKTQLLIDAKECGCKVISGLYMLVQQAIKSHELFMNKKIDDKLANKIYQSILLEKTNLVFIGMPSCGKTTAANNVSKILKRPRYDIDEEIEKDTQMSISKIFETQGESYFRKLESDKIKEVFQKEGAIISLGGGSLMTEDNVNLILRNSIVIFLNRDLNLLKKNKKAMQTRPLLQEKESFDVLYAQRLPIYLKCADIVIKNNGTALNTRNLILEKLL